LEEKEAADNENGFFEHRANICCCAPIKKPLDFYNRDSGIALLPAADYNFKDGKSRCFCFTLGSKFWLCGHSDFCISISRTKIFLVSNKRDCIVHFFQHYCVLSILVSEILSLKILANSQ
jgi:hypothetical protein